MYLLVVWTICELVGRDNAWGCWEKSFSAEKLGWREVGQAVEKDSKIIIIRTMKLHGPC